jgi:hypothetical protein
MLSPGPPLTPLASSSARSQPYAGSQSPQTVRATTAHVKAYLPNGQISSVSWFSVFYCMDLCALAC